MKPNVFFVGILVLLTINLFTLSKVNAQCSSSTLIQTPFDAPGNIPTDGIMFDVQAVNDITINCMSSNFNAGSHTVRIYSKSGTHVGFETDPLAWTLEGTTTVFSSGLNNATYIPINLNLSLNSGQTRSFYVTVTNDNREYHYSIGSAVGNIIASDANVRVREGTGKWYLFGSSFTPRRFNGIIYYNAAPPPVSGPCANNNVAAPVGQPQEFNCDAFKGVSVGGGTYVDFDVEAGASYSFSTCNGTLGDTKLTGYNQNNGTQVFFFEDNGPFCSPSTKASGDWIASFSGTLRVNVDESTCTYSTTSTLLQYRQNNTVTLNSFSTQDICAGATRALSGSPIGGTFTIDPSGGTISGNTLTASNNTGSYTLTYTLGECSASGTIEILESPSDPGSISANPSSTICPGENVQLTVNGGDLGVDGEYVWYLGNSCGGTVFQNSGNSPTITVTPSSTTTYSVRIESSCGNTSCINYTVNVRSQSSPPTNASVTPSSNICVGDQITLTASGGSLATGGDYEWYIGGCGNGSSIGTGSSIQVNAQSGTTTYYVRAEDNCVNTSCASVSVSTNSNSTPPTGISPTNNNFCPGTQVTLNRLGGSLSAGAQWVWYEGLSCCNTLVGFGNSITVAPNVTTNYYLRAEGGCGTTSFVSQTITVKEESVTPTAINASTTQVCGSTSNSVNLSVNGGSLGTGASWQWYTGSCGGTSVGSGSSINVTNLTSTTTYFVRAEGDCNNTGCASQVITVSTGFDITSTNFTNPSCNGGSDGSVSVTATGGITPYTYNWSVAGSGSSISGLSAGSYSVTVSDAAGCSDVASFNLVDPPLLTITNVSSNDILCNGASTGSITITASGGTSPLEYSVDGGGNFQPSASFSGLPAGSYNLQVRDDNSCLRIFSGNPVVLTEPTPLVLTLDSFDNASCSGANDGEIYTTASGGTPPYDYSINGGPFQPSNDFASLSAGSYTVLVRDDNGCTETVTQSISNQTALVVFEVSSTDASCFGASDGSATFDVLNGTAPINYTINNITFQTNPTFNNLSAGTYTVLASDALGCSNDTTFTIGEPDEIVITVDSVENIGCSGSSTGEIYITATGGNGNFSYNWSDGSNNEDRTGLAVGSYTVTVTDANNCQNTTTVTLTQAPPLFLSLADIDSIDCNGIASGGVDITVNGGTAPYSYSWSNGKSSEDISGLTPGTYTVTVTDDNGCQLIDSWTLTQPTAISISGTVTDANCNVNATGSISTNVSGGTAPYSYNWSNGATAQNISNLVAGTYILTVTDAKGCEETETFNVDDPNALTINETVQDVSCFGGNDGEISVNVSGGTAPYTYSWTNGSSGSSISGLTAGTYGVTVTDDNGCSTFTSVVVDEPDEIIITSVDQPASCDGSVPGEINVNVSGGTMPYSYNWSNGASTQDLTGLTAGTYTLTLTDNNSCVSIYTTTISNTDAPNVIATVNDASCNGGNDGSISTFVSGGVAPYSYNWSTGSTTQNVSGLSAGTYSVTVTGNNGCVTVKSYNVGEASPIVITLDNLVNANCALNQTGSIDISVSGGTPPFTYLWTNFETTQDLSNLSAGNYTVIVTDANGCEATTSYTVTDPVNLTAALTITDVSCNGGSDGSIGASFSGGTPPYTFNWSTGSTASSISGLSAGLYSFTITDDNGCQFTVGDFVEEPDPIAITGVVTDANCAGTTTGDVDITVSGGTSPYSYNWSNGPVTEDISGLLAGTYTVTVTDDNNCIATASFNVSQVDSIELLANINNIECAGDSNGSIITTVVKGQPPYTYTWSNGATTQSISGLSAGNYTVTLTDASSCIIIETFTVTEPTPIVVSLDSINDADCSQNITGDIFISVSGGTPPYSYLWANGATTQDISNLSAGTYVVEVTDGNGCTENASYTVNDPANISHTATVTDVSCFGSADGEITINVTGGTTPYTYNWTNGGSGVTISNLEGGLYGVTVEDAAACTYFASFVVEEYDSLLLSAIFSDVDCNGNSNGSIDLIVSGGKAPLSYAWNSGATTQDLVNISAGVYRVTVTDDSGCSDSLTVAISEPAPININANVNDVSCNGGSDGDIFLTVNGGTPPLNYNWSTGATTANLTGVTAGTYGVTVTDDNGCIETSSYTINEPTTLITAIDSVVDADCQNGVTGSVFISVSGGVTPYSYLWNSGQQTQDITGLSKGTYTVVVEDANGCTASASAFVDDPFGITATDSVVDVTCAGGSDGEIYISVAGGTGTYTYNWNTGDSTQNLTGVVAGNYAVTISDANGCDLFLGITVDEPDSILLTTTVDDANCAGTSTGSIDLSVSGGSAPYSYLWSTSSTTQDITGLLAGTFSVTVTDDNGCTATTSANVSQVDSMELLANIEDVSCFGGKDGRIFTTVKYGQAPYVYSWSSGQTTGDITGLTAGTYTVTMTDAVNCILIETYTVSQPSQIVTSVSTTDALCNGDATGSVNLNVNGGTPPYTYLWSNFDSSRNLSNVEAGLYTVIIEDDNGCTVTNSASVGEPAPITVSDSIVDVTCNGNSDGAIYLSVNGGTPPFTFNWSNGATTQNLTSVAAATYSVTVTDFNSCSDTFTYKIFEPLPLSISSDVNDVNCNGGSDGAIDITVSGGTLPYSYIWNNGATSEDLNALSAGIYTVTVTDSNGCTISQSDTVNEPALIVVSDSVTDVSCSGGFDGAIDISVTGGIPPYDYEWSNGLVSQDISGLFAGSYSVTVTDDNNCEMVEVYTVNEPAPLSASFTGNDALCFGDSTGNIDLTVTGGTSPYTYDWSNGATTQDLNNIPAGLYTVEIEDDNGCRLIASYSIGQPSLLSVSGAITNVTCFGGFDGEIDLTVSGGTPSYTYDWSSGQTTEDIVGISAGMYTVVVTDDNSCTDTSSYTVTQPDSFNLSAQIIDVDCYGASTGGIDISVSGSNPPYDYNWSSGDSTQDVFGLPAGMYMLTIVDVDGCSDTSSYTINQPDSLETTITSVDLACNGIPTGSIDLAVIGGTPPYRYLWNSGQTTQDLNNINAGFYAVTVTDFNGCTKFDSVTVTQPDALNASANVTNILCNGDSTGAIDLTPLGGTPPYSYSWSNGEVTQDLSNLSAGLYTVTITDDSSCTTALTYNVSEPPLLDFDGVVRDVLCYGRNGGTISVSPTGGVQPYSYDWSNGDTTSFVGGLFAGDYGLTLTDANGCVKTDTFTITQPDSIALSSVAFDATCNGSFDGAIDLTVTGGVQPYTYLWNNFEFTEDISGLNAGRYAVIVTDSNGCSAVDSVFVGQPNPIVIDVFVKGAGCGNATGGIIDLTVTGGTPGYDFLWSTGDTTEDLTNLGAGTYNVTVSDSNACEEVRSIVIPSFPEPVPGFVAEDICFENAIVFENTSVIASGTMDFYWDYGNGDTDSLVENPTYVYPDPGTYVVTLTAVSNRNCSNSFSDTITVFPLPDPTISGTGGDPCVIDSVTLSVASGATSYEWSTGDTTTSISVIESGVYGVSVVNEFGCLATDTIPVFISEISNVEVSNDTTINFGFGAELFATGGEDYVWSPTESIDNPFVSTPIVTPQVNTTYTVVISDDNGCVFTDTVEVTVSDEILLDIPNIITPNGDGFNDEWRIKNILNYEICQVSIFNRWGNEVYSERGYNNDWNGVGSNGKELSDGTYYYVIDCDEVQYKGAVTILR